MRRSLLNNFALFAVLVVFAGCSSKRSIIQPVAAAVPTISSVISVPTAKASIKSSTNKTPLDSIIAGKVVFETISIKAKADLAIDNMGSDVNLNIRIKNDKAIWMSVTALAGLEVARILITPDSVKILNRIENVYIKKPFDYIYQYANRQINFRTLQDIIVGNPIERFLNGAPKLVYNDGKAGLSGSSDELTFDLLFDENFKLTALTLVDSSANQSLQVSFGRFVSLFELRIPHTLVLKSKAANNRITGNLEYSRVDVNLPIELPFNVPQRFTIKN